MNGTLKVLGILVLVPCVYLAWNAAVLVGSINIALAEFVKKNQPIDATIVK